MEHKFTDDEIVKAYEACLCVNCRICPLACVYDCGSRVEIGIPEIYNRQKEEIETLRSQVNRLKKYDEERDIRLHARLTETARAEAYKEFAERLKKDLFYKCGDINYSETCDTRRLIDNLVKEMTEEGTE